jgi:hypothetical protein
MFSFLAEALCQVGQLSDVLNQIAHTCLREEKAV